MGFLSVLSMAHKWTAERTAPGDCVIDATAGTGVDTLALAELVGGKGIVYAFDIQQEALNRTLARIQERIASLREAEARFTDEPSVSGRNEPAVRRTSAGRARLAEVRLVLGSHADMERHVDPDLAGRIAAVMFNLGYLPGGGDPSVITEPSSTLAALDSALGLLRKGGIITCVLYPGHPGGAEEAAAVEQYAAALPQKLAQAIVYRQPQRLQSPYLVAIEKR